ncbi:MAG: hypothetical protein ABI165_01820 [Bryobacteraceae bacterium]
MWKRYRDLYIGGEHLKNHADQYLVRRQKEPADVYAERLYRVFYENYIGSIVDWYAATLFRREPAIIFEGANEAGKAFFSGFTEDCDLKGTTLTDFLRRQLVEAAVSGATYVLVDFPRAPGPAGNRAEEDALGRSRAYLVEYTPEDVINWSHDERGNYEWVVVRTTSLRKDRVEDEHWARETRWTYYDKQNFRVYRKVESGTEKGHIELIDEGTHGLAKQNQVPLFRLELSKGLWLMNKAGLLQLEHFNKSNALSWALTMGLFAMPVVYSDRPWNQIAGESYYIQLGPEDRFGWTEPEGKVFQVAADNLNRLKEEIYRVCYLSQAGGPLSGPAAQSGLSKQRDFSITQEVLRAYGDAVKELLKRVLRAIETAREDGLEVNVLGLDEFDIGDFSSELADAQALLALGIDSPTMKQQVFKKLALKFLCDTRQEIKERIAEEIDAAG